MPPAFFKSMGIKAPPEKGDYFVDLFQYLKEKHEVDLAKDERRFDEMYSRAAERPWKEKQFPQIAEWLKAQDKPLAVAVNATKLENYFSPVYVLKMKNGVTGVIAVFRPLSQIQKIADALIIRAMLQIGQNNSDQAWQDMIAAHRLARLVARSSTVVEVMHAIAMEYKIIKAELVILNEAKWNAKQVKARQADLLKLPPVPSLAARVNIGERFMLLDALMRIDRYGADYLQSPFLDQVGKLKSEPLTGKVDWDLGLIQVNDWCDELCAAIKTRNRTLQIKRISEFELKLAKLREETKRRAGLPKIKMSPKMRGRYIADAMIGLNLLASIGIQTKADRSEQTRRNCHVAYSLAAFHADYGQFPKRLEDLNPKYLAAFPIDIFSGKSLIYRRSDKGYLLYSVGANGIDEKGHWRDDKFPDSDDLAVKMPLPKWRQ